MTELAPRRGPARPLAAPRSDVTAPRPLPTSGGGRGGGGRRNPGCLRELPGRRQVSGGVVGLGGRGKQSRCRRGYRPRGARPAGQGNFLGFWGAPPHPAVPLRLHPPRCEGGERTRDGGTPFPPPPPALSRGKGDGWVAVVGIDPPKKGLPPTHTSKPVMLGAGAPRGVRERQSFVAGEVDVPLCPHPPRVVVVGEMLRVLSSSPPRVPPGAARSLGAPARTWQKHRYGPRTT